MKYASDFRYIAREALRYKWKLASLTTYIASLIGATIGSSYSSSSSSSNNNSNGENNNSIFSFFEPYFSDDSIYLINGIIGLFAVVALVQFIITLIIGGAGKLGFARFNLNIVDGKEARFDDLFSQFHRLGDGFVMISLLGLYTFLWALLFLIPGIIKMYSYVMTPYIFYEHPEYGVNSAISESRYIMNGNKWRLFCLQLSFIGWHLLCSVPTIIAFIFVMFGNFLTLPLILLTFVGEIVLRAYIEVAQAAFYREITWTEDKDKENNQNQSNKEGLYVENDFQ